MQTKYNVGDRVYLIEPMLEGNIVKITINGRFPDSCIYTIHYWDDDSIMNEVEVFDYEFELIKEFSQADPQSSVQDDDDDNEE